MFNFCEFGSQGDGKFCSLDFEQKILGILHSPSHMFQPLGTVISQKGSLDETSAQREKPIFIQ